MGGVLDGDCPKAVLTQVQQEPRSMSAGDIYSRRRACEEEKIWKYLELKMVLLD